VEAMATEQLCMHHWVILKSVHSAISAIDRYLRQRALSGTVGHSACRLAACVDVT